MVKRRTGKRKRRRGGNVQNWRQKYPYDRRNNFKVWLLQNQQQLLLSKKLLCKIGKGKLKRTQPSNIGVKRKTVAFSVSYYTLRISVLLCSLKKEN